MRLHLHIYSIVLIVKTSYSLNNFFQSLKMSTTPSAAQKIITSGKIPTWENLESKAFGTPFGEDWQREEALREKGNGAAHTNAKVRLFGTTGEPRITFFRDTAAWCPYW